MVKIKIMKMRYGNIEYIKSVDDVLADIRQNCEYIVTELTILLQQIIDELISEYEAGLDHHFTTLTIKDRNVLSYPLYLTHKKFKGMRILIYDTDLDK